MDRAEWLKHMRDRSQALYDRLSPQYWATFGLYANETHREYLGKFLERVPPHSVLLSAACGAGRYDGMLLEAGHRVVGIDQSAGMLARARGHFPEVRYEQIGLQEMDFHEAFDGAICIDAMEHVCPEDWPEILRRLREALKPSGVLYFTAEPVEGNDVDVAAAYERAKAMGLPVVFGEVADKVDEAFERIMALGTSEVPGELTDEAAYHYHPSLEQVRAWLEQVGFTIEEEGRGTWYEHLVVRKK